MSFQSRWVRAQFNLAMRSAIHYLKKAWPWRQRFGLERFRENYVPEGLPAYSKSFRVFAHEPSRCTTCGLCDAACPLVLEPSEKDFLGPMKLVISGMRGGPTLADVESTLRTVASKECESCSACEKACPEQIPIVALAREFSGQWQEVLQMRSKS